MLVEAEFLESATSEQEASGISGSPVGQTMLDAVAFELMSIGGTEDLVTGDLRGDDLGDDIAVGETNDETVLWCAVLVLRLGDEALAGVVVSLTYGNISLTLSSGSVMPYLPYGACTWSDGTQD